jgi:protein SOK2
MVQGHVPSQVQNGTSTMPIQPSTTDYYAAARYPYQPNYMYNQMPNQISQPQPQPQPQHYNAYSASTTSNNPSGPISVVAAPIASGSSAAQSGTTSTPIQDTLNTSATSSVGQYQPPGIRPRVTTTMWEDEKTLCYQVDANNVSVVRRADNNMINGTKLLNVAQMTRGRRDGILKSEKVRHVVKIGSMHLKGVWIPFERALAMAQREGIVDLLYPLFVRDIKRVIQTGVTPAGAAGAAAANTTGVSGTGASGVGATASGATSATSVKSNGAATTYHNYQPDYSQYNQVNGGSNLQQPGVAGVSSGDPKLQQMYGYQQPLQLPQQQYYNSGAQQYPYYNQYNQYSGQMYQNYGYQVPPALHQQPAPVSGNTESSETKKEEK